MSISRTTSSFRPTVSTRDADVDSTTYVLILLVVLIPVIFTIILCTITYCVYRYNKKRSQTARRYASTIADRSGAPIATVVYNPQHNPYILEELPPAYDSLEEIKKHYHQTTNQDSTVPSSDSQQRVTTIDGPAMMAQPSAPTPPPSYRELLDNSNHK